MKRLVPRACLFLIPLGCALSSILLLAAPRINVNTPMSPPVWALLGRELIRANTAACVEFFSRYFDDRGYFLRVTRWGATTGRTTRSGTARCGRSCTRSARPTLYAG